jgi:hypothetical protein
MAWKSYELDRAAQKLVLAARERDIVAKKTNPKESGSLNQAHKMRMAVAYGLERFWGEHLRLKGKKAADENKSKLWKETWDALENIMQKSGITIPNDILHPDNKGKVPTSEIEAMSEKLWNLSVDDQRVTLSVLTQLCDCIVWWTQRYKIGRSDYETDF